MITIHKLTLELTDRQSIPTHEGIKFLSAQLQNGNICVWGLIDTSMPIKSTVFHILGTGNTPNFQVKPDHFIGTVQEGRFVWHVFGGLES